MSDFGLQLERFGEGKKPVVLLIDTTEPYAELARNIQTELEEEGIASLLVSCRVPSLRDELASLSERLREKLDHQKIRNVPFLAFGSGASLLFHLYLAEPKRVRTMTLIDACSRSHPTKFERIVSSLESRLPLGLPFRRKSSGFDVKPFLQRVRCPVLVTTSWTASPFVRREGAELLLRLPTAWGFELLLSNLREFAAAVLSFQEVPAKCPQKNRRKVA